VDKKEEEKKEDWWWSFQNSILDFRNYFYVCVYILPLIGMAKGKWSKQNKAVNSERKSIHGGTAFKSMYAPNTNVNSKRIKVQKSYRNTGQLS